MKFRVGFGFDVHQYVDNRKLVLGGVTIAYSKGLSGHSDADAVIHAVIDALLGAAGLEDIGVHFPNTDPQYQNIDSRVLMRTVGEKIDNMGFEVSNIDITIVAQAPKMQPHTLAMKRNIASDLDLNINQINVKATTTESMGFVGRKEGVAVWAITALVAP